MTQVRKPKYTILYNKKDITIEVSGYLMSLVYNDAVEDKSDHVELEFSNTTGIWLDEWYPQLGDTLDITMGYDAQVFHCGIFEIDEIEAEFGPDVIKIKGIASGITSALRTKKSYAHENKTLVQIANTIASGLGMTVLGSIIDTGQISRETQEMETDLAFLKRISRQYGHAFSVRGQVITFTNIYQLEAIASATTVDKTNLQPGASIKDTSYDTFKKVHLLHYDTNSKKVLETDFSFPTITNVDGFSYNAIVKEDTKEVRYRVDSGTQGRMKAMAALHSSNSLQQLGTLPMLGNPFVLSGNNLTLTGVGKISGIYHIISSVHKITKDGYQTIATVKRVGYVTVSNIKPKKVKKHRAVRVSFTKQ